MQNTYNIPNVIEFQNEEAFSKLIKSLKYNNYSRSLFVYNQNLNEINAMRRVNFTKKWLEVDEINLFKYNFIQEAKGKKNQFSDFCKALKFNSNLQILLLDALQLGDDAIKNLASSLKINDSITYLALLANNIGETGAKYLSEMLFVNRTLETLMLENNCIGAEGCIYLAESLKKNSVLSTIVLRANKIGDSGVKKIGEMLKVNKSLQSIGLGDNHITENGFLYICEGLKNNNSLIHIWISENEINYKGAKYFSEILANENCQIQSFWAGNNNFCDEGAFYISQALLTNSSLTTLTINNNFFSHVGLKHIANSLKYNYSLVNLWLDGNIFQDLGFKSFAHGLKLNESLQTLWLNSDSVGKEGFNYLVKLFKVNETLKHVIFGGEKIDEQEFETFKEKVEKINKRRRLENTIFLDDEKEISNDSQIEVHDKETKKYEQSMNEKTDLKNPDVILKPSDQLKDDFKVNNRKDQQQLSEDNKNNNSTKDYKNPQNICALNKENKNNTDFKSQENKESYESNSENNISWDSIDHSEVSEDSLSKQYYLEDKKEESYDFRKPEKTGDYLELAKKFQLHINSLQEIKRNHNSKKNKNILKKETKTVPNEIGYQKLEECYNDIVVEKCFKSFKYLDLIEKIFLKCLKVKKYFDDSNISLIEKNFVDQINIDIDDELNNKDLFLSEDLNFTELEIQKRINNKYVKIYKNQTEVSEKNKGNDNISRKKSSNSDRENMILQNANTNDTDTSSPKSTDSLNKFPLEIINDKEKFSKIIQDTLPTIQFNNIANCNAYKNTTDTNSNNLHDLIKVDIQENPNQNKVGEDNFNFSDKHKPYINTQDKFGDKNSLKNHTINFKEIELLKNEKNNSLLTLQRGAFSKVILGIYWDKIISIKQIDSTKVNREKMIEEINFKIDNCHPFINRIYGFCEIDSDIFLLCKLNDCLNLFDLIHERKLLLPIKNLIFYISNIIEAINFNHKKNVKIIYKDLKLQNIYLTKNGQNAFLDDFGFAKHFYTNKTKNQKHCGTIYYMAPELLKGEEFHLSADIYALGMMLYEIFSVNTPYENKSDIEIIKMVVSGQRPSLDNLRKDTPKEFLDLITRCWHQDQLKRPNSDDILFFMTK